MRLNPKDWIVAIAIILLAIVALVYFTVSWIAGRDADMEAGPNIATPNSVEENGEKVVKKVTAEYLRYLP